MIAYCTADHGRRKQDNADNVWKQGSESHGGHLRDVVCRFGGNCRFPNV